MLSRKGEWRPYTADADTIVVNIGDMLQRLTNHVLPSTTHRVVPTRRREGAPAALFDAVLPAPEPGFPDRRAAELRERRQPGAAARADHAQGYLDERLREIKLK